MNRRNFIGQVVSAAGTIAISGCSFNGGISTPQKPQIMTVNGFIDADDMGLTLTHEHLVADLRPYAVQMLSNTVALDSDEVMEVVLPHLQAIRALGCRTLVECTATHLGRNPLLIKRLSDASGLHMLTVTGNYLAADGRFIPPYVTTDSAAELVGRWVNEWLHGIEDTGIRPGLIKLGFNGGALTTEEDKLIHAAAEAHLQTGLTIGAHVGPWRTVDPGFNGRSALDQIAVLEKFGISPSAWIWIHAQNEPDANISLQVARRGAWISFDGFRPEGLQQYIQILTRVKSENLLNKVLVSQDAGWYNVGEPRGGNFSPYAPLFTSLIPALRAHDFSEHDIETIFVRNPAAAFAVHVRKV